MDQDGWMMNETRFSKEMTRYEVFKPYFNEVNKRLRVRVADPGRDVTSGYRPMEEAMQWSQTKAARGALSMKPGLMSTAIAITEDDAFLRLVRLMAACISAEPLLRPATLTEILEVLHAVQRDHPWDETSAADWWGEHEQPLLRSASSSKPRRRGDT